MTQPPPFSPPFGRGAGCPQCGEPRAPAGREETCPKCGYEPGSSLFTFPEEATLIVGDAKWGETEPDAGSDTSEIELHALIGADLDVYHIDSLLGRGGMGHVYLAHHRDLQRPCALKILSPRLAAQDKDYVQRFLNEGRAAAALIHPNVITIHAIGEARNFYFLEMEFVPGRSLRQLLQDEGPLPPVRAASLAARVADGLAVAHGEQIIHRDLKADNVLLTLQDVPKLADFGLCKRIRSGNRSTLPEGLCGTPSYMAPELFQGKAADPTTDVYALGVTFFLMLTGQFPFSGESLPALMCAATTHPVPDLRQHTADVPLEMAECVNLLLDKSPSNRPANGHEAGALLHAVLGQLRDLYTLVEEAFRNDPHVSWDHTGDRFRATVRFPSRRRQTVIIEPSPHHAAAERLLLIYSTCCVADPAFYESALRLNSDMPHGSVAIREIDGQLQFVVVDTYPRATVDAEEIRRSTREVASRADTIEKMLTGQDAH